MNPQLPISLMHDMSPESPVCDRVFICYVLKKNIACLHYIVAKNLTATVYMVSIP